jgi:hypothetical protein
MRCEEVRARFAGHLTGSLDAGQDADLLQHVRSCADCQAEFAGIEPLWDALGEVPAAPVPSSRMRERFAAMLDAERASAGRKPASFRTGGRLSKPSFWPREPLVQMALAASLLIVGVLVGRALPPSTPAPQPDAEIAEVRSELRDMRQMLTLSLLQQQSATERLRGVSWTSQLEQPGNDVVTALLDTLLHDPNDNVRLASVEALRRFADRDDVRQGTVRAATDVSSPLLQIAAIDFIVETRAPQAAEVLRQISQNQAMDELVRGRAEVALSRLAS